MFDPRLMIAPAVGGQVKKAFEEGQQKAAQNKARAAMAALVRDPNNRGALEALASVDPQSAMQFQQRQQQQAMAGLEQHREKIVMGAQIVRQFQPKDQAGWDQVLATAGQMGIDLRDVPREFNEQYAKGLMSVADAFKPQPQNNGQIVPFTQGGGVARYNPQTGQVETLVMPNPGDKPTGSPVGSGPPPGAIVPDPRLQGGSTPPASSNFPQ